MLACKHCFRLLWLCRLCKPVLLSVSCHGGVHCGGSRCTWCCQHQQQLDPGRAEHYSSCYLLRGKPLGLSPSVCRIILMFAVWSLHSAKSSSLCSYHLSELLCHLHAMWSWCVRPALRMSSTSSCTVCCAVQRQAIFANCVAFGSVPSKSDFFFAPTCTCCIGFALKVKS